MVAGSAVIHGLSVVMLWVDLIALFALRQFLIRAKRKACGGGGGTTAGQHTASTHNHETNLCKSGGKLG